MKTKEIEVWVRAKEEDLLNHPEFGFKVYPRDPLIQDNTFKARLVFDLPERKAEITESQVDKFIESLDAYNPKDWAHPIETFKKKIFGGEG